MIKEVGRRGERPPAGVRDIAELELCLVYNSGSGLDINSLWWQKLLQLLKGAALAGTWLKYRGTYSLIYSVQPFFSRHIDLENNIQVAFRVRMFVCWHAFASGDDGLSRLDDLSWRAAHVDTPSIEMRH